MSSLYLIVGIWAVNLLNNPSQLYFNGLMVAHPFTNQFIASKFITIPLQAAIRYYENTFTCFAAFSPNIWPQTNPYPENKIADKKP